MNFSKTFFYLFTALMIGAFAYSSLKPEATRQDQPGKIPLTYDLQQESRLNTQHLPLLLMFSIKDCPYCVIVREEFLEPMKISGDYENRIIMRIINMDEARLNDFDGRTVKLNELARRYKVKLAPTVVLVDNQGRLLAEPLVGITTRDYYGGYLDQAIDEAVARSKQ